MGGVGLGGQSGCERRIEVFVKIQKKIKKFLGGGWGVGGGGGVGVGLGGQSGCERRIEVLVKIPKKKNFFLGGGVRWGGGGVGGGVRVDVNEELKKKIGGGGVGGSVGGVGLGGGSGWM